jgi:hypothetical protein
MTALSKAASMTAAEVCARGGPCGEQRPPRNLVAPLDLLVGFSSQKRLIFWMWFLRLETLGFASLSSSLHGTAIFLHLNTQLALLSLDESAWGGGTLLALAGSGDGAMKNPNDRFVAMLKSRSLDDAMVDRFNRTGRFKTPSVRMRRVLE